MRVSRRVPTLSRFPAVAGHLKPDVLCPCRRGPMPRWCGVAVLAAVCEIKPGSRPGATQVQRGVDACRSGEPWFVDLQFCGRAEISESVRVCPPLNPFAYARRRRAEAYAGAQRDFIEIALGVGSVLVPGGAGMLKRDRGEFRTRCALSRRRWRVGGAPPQKYRRWNGSPHSLGPEVAALHGV